MTPAAPLPARRARLPRRLASRGALTLALSAACLSPAVARAEAPERGTYAHFLGAATVGRSLRFNNPYRLEEPIGRTPESVSLAASYLDLSLSAMLGRPWGLQQGAWLHWSRSLGGIAQQVLAPSYVALYRWERGSMGYARAGLPFVLAPNQNVGGELGVGGVYPLTGALGLTGELSGSLFYGAATREVAATLIPLLSLQLGVSVDWEVLP